MYNKAEIDFWGDICVNLLCLLCSDDIIGPCVCLMFAFFFFSCLMFLP